MPYGQGAGFVIRKSRVQILLLGARWISVHGPESSRRIVNSLLVSQPPLRGSGGPLLTSWDFQFSVLFTII